MSSFTTTPSSPLNSNLLDGRKVAEGIRKSIKKEADALYSSHTQKPKLSIVLVGERPDSAVYVRMKQKACEECGIEFELHKFADDVDGDSVATKVLELNADPNVDGIIVQLPLPKHICEEKLLSFIDPTKDVDGLLPETFGRLATKLSPRFIPCTAAGCMELLKFHNVCLEGANAVVVGRSKIVGLPVSLLLQQANATVTMCHSKTKNLQEKLQSADIVVVAIGQAKFVKGEWLKEGCVVIDAGINSMNIEGGTRLVGDVDYEECKKRASLITPVPGGVGPMTVACLVRNVLRSRQLRITSV